MSSDAAVRRSSADTTSDIDDARQADDDTDRSTHLGVLVPSYGVTRHSQSEPTDNGVMPPALSSGDCCQQERMEWQDMNGHHNGNGPRHTKIERDRNNLKKQENSSEQQCHMNIERLHQLEQDKEQKQKAMQKEQLEREKIQKEQAHKEKMQREQLEKEKMQKEKIRKETLQKEKMQREQLEKENKLQKEKLQKEKIQREQLEKEKLQKEKLQKEKLQKEKIQREQLEKEKLQKEKIQREQLEKEKLQKEKLQKEKLQKEKIQREQLEKEKLQKEKIQREQLEKEKLQKEKIQREQLEKEKLQKEKLQKEKLQKEKIQREQLEKEKLQKEKIQREQLEKEKLQKEKIQREQLEKEKLQKEKIRKETLQKEKMQREQLETEKLQKEKIQREQLEKEKLQKEKIRKETLQKEKIQREQLEKEKMQKEKLQKEKIQREQLEKEKMQKEKLQKEKIQREQLEKEKMQKEKIHREQLEKEKLKNEKMQDEKIPMEQLQKEQMPINQLPEAMNHITVSPDIGPGDMTWDEILSSQLLQDLPHLCDANVTDHHNYPNQQSRDTGHTSHTLVPGHTSHTLVPGHTSHTLVPGHTSHTLVPGHTSHTLVPGHTSHTLVPALFSDVREDLGVGFKDCLVRPEDIEAAMNMSDSFTCSAMMITVATGRAEAADFSLSESLTMSMLEAAEGVDIGDARSTLPDQIKQLIRDTLPGSPKQPAFHCTTRSGANRTCQEDVTTEEAANIATDEIYGRAEVSSVERSSGRKRKRRKHLGIARKRTRTSDTGVTDNSFSDNKVNDSVDTDVNISDGMLTPSPPSGRPRRFVGGVVCSPIRSEKVKARKKVGRCRQRHSQGEGAAATATTRPMRVSTELLKSPSLKTASTRKDGAPLGSAQHAISPSCNDDNKSAVESVSLGMEGKRTTQQSLQVSQASQSFTIIDVAADTQLFESFIAEWKTQALYSLSVACEKVPVDPAAGIGGKFNGLGRWLLYWLIIYILYVIFLRLALDSDHTVLL